MKQFRLANPHPAHAREGDPAIHHFAPSGRKPASPSPILARGGRFTHPAPNMDGRCVATTDGAKINDLGAARGRCTHTLQDIKGISVLAPFLDLDRFA
jgi:hypothetical protein